MRAANTIRASGLPAVGAALISVVLGVQLASGGGGFVPLAPPHACEVREVTSISTGIDGLTERLVLIGLDRAACHLGLTREALILQLAQQREPTTAQVDALRAGLTQAVEQMNKDGVLPPASKLVRQSLDSTNLNGVLKAALRALPDSVINRSLKTDDVLRRTINNLDLRVLLTNLNNPDQLARQIDAAVTTAVKQSLEARLRGLV